MIITNNEKALRIQCQKVEDNEINDLITQLENELNYVNSKHIYGIGLAAPQIGIAKNIAIVRFNNVLINLINPIITKSEDLKFFKEEGCLSFPGRVETTKRFQKITINNNSNFINLKGLEAVVCQHEIDHLNGILLPDRIFKPPVNLNSFCPCGSNKKFKKCCNLIKDL